MDIGNIFLNMSEDGEYDRYADGTLRVYLCIAPHESVQNAWYVEKPRRNAAGEIKPDPRGSVILKEAMMAKWPEVIE